jgi:protein-disulfide isomerase
MSEPTEVSNEAIPEEASRGTDTGGELRFKRSHFYVALLPIAFVTGLAAGFIFWGRDAGASDAPPSVAVQPGNQPIAKAEVAPGEMRFEVETDDDPALGPEDAPIVIVEFSDFNCPFCRKFHDETFPALFEAFPDQIRFVYRDFPVVGGFEAAQASECADEQGAFWDYHNLLFTGGGEPGRTTYLQYASDLELDTGAFETCLDEERIASEVETDARYAASLGITGTPTFFINGIPLVGAQPLQTFRDIIESELGS